MSFIDQLSKVIGKAIINNGNGTINQMDKLPKFLSMCNYSDEVKSMIQKAVRQILSVFPNFKVQLLQFYNNRQIFRFIEMKTSITVPYLPQLQLYLMFPSNFPSVPPYFRVVNPNPQSFTLKANLAHAQSRNDPKSLILNSLLYETKGWSPSKSVVNIIIQINNFVRNNYPYVRLQSYAMWGRSKVDFQPSSPYNNQSPRNNISPYQQSPMKNQSVNQVISKGAQLHSKFRDKLNKLSYSHTQILPKIQLLDSISNSIRSEEEYLRTENYKMGEILTKENNEVNLATLVQPKDKYSQKLLDYFSSIKARGNVATLLEEKFNAMQISLQQFLRHIKRNEENKFMEKYIMIRMIDEGQIQA